jgi:hypothetical protein
MGEGMEGWEMVREIVGKGKESEDENEKTQIQE